MSGTMLVTASLAKALTEAGVPAVQAWERRRLPELSGPAAVVGVEELAGGDAGLWDYLGLAELEDGRTAERYGRRLALKVFVDVYAPRDASGAWEQALETVEELLLETGAAGLRVETLRREEGRSERSGGYLRCRCAASASAYMTAARAEEGAPLTDFELKGVVKG